MLLSGWTRVPSLKNQLYPAMLSWTVTFLVVALIAAVLGFGGIAGAAAGVAKICFFIFLVFFLISLITGRRAVP